MASRGLIALDGLRACAAVAVLASGLAIAGCGSTRKLEAGSARLVHPRGTSAIDDPRTPHMKCLRTNHIGARRVGLTTIQVDGGPTVVFEPTSNIAQGLQINGTVQGAEVIGQALLYPGNVGPAKLKLVENCMNNSHY